jgi:hypothetical protein
MKTQIAMFIASMCLLLACSEDDTIQPDQPGENAATYFPATAGSYWVYDTYRIDSSGTESIYAESDTLLALGDTLIEGTTYHVLYGGTYALSFPSTAYVRDSSGYIVNYPDGRIIVSYTNFDDVISTEQINPFQPEFTLSNKMERYQGSVNLPAGTFAELLNRNQSLMNANNDSTLITTANLYAPNVGQITRTYFYLTDFMNTGTYYEDRLVAYYIASTP